MGQTKNGKVKVALDLDGVIWDLVTPWLASYNEKYKDNIELSDVHDYDLSKCCTHASLNELCAIIADVSFWDKVNLFPEAFDAIKRLNEEYDLMIATKTDYRIFEMKVRKLLTLLPFISANQIICISNKSLLNVDYLVDDCLDNLKDGKFKKIILDAPYNRENNIYYRANNLNDVLNIIEKDKNL